MANIMTLPRACGLTFVLTIVFAFLSCKFTKNINIESKPNQARVRSISRIPNLIGHTPIAIELDSAVKHICLTDWESSISRIIRLTENSKPRSVNFKVTKTEEQLLGVWYLMERGKREQKIILDTYLRYHGESEPDRFMFPHEEGVWSLDENKLLIWALHPAYSRLIECDFTGHGRKIENCILPYSDQKYPLSLVRAENSE
ncbi:MAG TPA: hypothetical protein PKJ84_15910 [Anaerolineales bacterium]|nr:hypothetical protein [Anaerolineales bacterium]